MANEDSKVCPLIRQQCIKSRCEFFHAALKKCEISVISYNVFRLAASTKPSTGNGRNPTNSNGNDFSRDNSSPVLPQYERIEPRL